MLGTPKGRIDDPRFKARNEVARKWYEAQERKDNWSGETSNDDNNANAQVRITAAEFLIIVDLPIFLMQLFLLFKLILRIPIR